MKRVLLIIQARMTSTRLPGKVMKNVLGKPLLAYLMERVLRVNKADQIVVATTKNKEDDVIAKFCKENSVHIYRGKEDDVLSRFYEVAVTYSADVIVRITGDCPLIDPAVIDIIIGHYLKSEGKFDFVSNTIHRSFPRGMDVEVFSFDALAEAFHYSKSKSEKEHVTPYIYNNTEKYKLGGVLNEENFSDYRLTVDTKQDFTLIEKILSAIYPKNPTFSMEDILQLLERNPSWSNINKSVKQKTT
jgi:spore coat polysaccharide biosynthesis protein SpsF